MRTWTASEFSWRVRENQIDFENYLLYWLLMFFLRDPGAFFLDHQPPKELSHICSIPNPISPSFQWPCDMRLLSLIHIYIYLIVCCIPFICPRISIILYSIISGAEKSPIVQMSSQSPLLWLIIIRGYILINVYWRWIYNPRTGNPFSTRKGEERAYPLHSHEISPSLSRLYPHCIPSLLVRYD